jgi:hypothetical protein
LGHKDVPLWAYFPAGPVRVRVASQRQKTTEDVASQPTPTGTGATGTGATGTGATGSMVTGTGATGSMVTGYCRRPTRTAMAPMVRQKIATR